MGRTSGPGLFLGCTASLSRASPQHQDADHLWLSGEGGAEIRAPSPSTPTPCSLPLSPSPSLISHLSLLPPTLAAILRRTKPIMS